RDNFDRLGFGHDMAENLRPFDVETGGARKVDVVAGIDTHDADILAGRFGAIARATRHRHLNFRRRPRAPEEFLELDAEAGGILGAETAPVGSDAGLYRAQALRIGMARNETRFAEIAPH